MQVLILQGYLAKRGHYNGALDSSFGPMTEVAVKALQQEGGLAVDGICGPVTSGYIARNM